MIVYYFFIHTWTKIVNLTYIFGGHCFKSWFSNKKSTSYVTMNEVMLLSSRDLFFPLTWRRYSFQSDDCTVFFFTVGDTYKPVGFIETASPVVAMEWSEKKGKVNYLDLSWRSLYLYSVCLIEH